MALSAPIIVRLEVDAMKHQIMHAFSQHQLEMSDEVERAVNEAIEHFDFAAEVRRVVHRELPQMVEAAVEGALRRAVYSEDVKAILDAAVLAGAKKVVASGV